MAASDVCQVHNGHVIGQHGISRPNSNRFGLSFNGTRPKTDQPSVTPRDAGEFTDQESLVSTERSKLLQRPKTSRPLTRRTNRTFIKDENGQNASFFLAKNTNESHSKQAPAVVNGYHGYRPGYDFQSFSGIIRDDEDYYLDMDPIEYFYSPVFDLYPYGYLLNNKPSPGKHGPGPPNSRPLPVNGSLTNKVHFDDSVSKQASVKDSIETSTDQIISDFTLKANPYPPKSRLPVPVANPTFRKTQVKYGSVSPVRTIEYRRDLFEPKQKSSPFGPSVNSSSSLSNDRQTEQTKAAIKGRDTLSNSKISYPGAKRKQNDTAMKPNSTKSKLDALDRNPVERRSHVADGDFHHRPLKDDPEHRMKSREKCSNNRLAEYSQNRAIHNVTKRPTTELPTIKPSSHGKQSLKYLGNREKSHKSNDKWTSTGRVTANCSLLAKQNFTGISNLPQSHFNPKPPEISNQNKSREQFAGRRPLSEDVSNIMKDNSSSLDSKEGMPFTTPVLVKPKHPYLRTGKQMSLPKIRPQTERPPALEQKPLKSPARKLKPVLVKLDDMHF